MAMNTAVAADIAASAAADSLARLQHVSKPGSLIFNQ